MPTGSRLILLIIMAICMLTGCGLDNDDDRVASYEKALYMAYATSRSGETMNIITTTDLTRVVDTITGMMSDYAGSYGFSQIQNTINLDSAPTGWNTVPSGMHGTITYDTSTLYVTMDLTLSNCEIATSRFYSGTLSAEGYLDSNYATSDITITASNLDIDYTITDYESVDFTNFVLTVNKTGTYPAYTYDGALTYGNRSYAYSSFRIQQTAATTKTASGKLIISGSYYGISATITTDANGYWTSGTSTITEQSSDATINETVTVTLSGTTASFQITDGDNWEVTNWYSEQLAP